MLDSLCAVPGIRVGHAHDEAARTGCTVILPDRPAMAGVDVRGSAPGSREIEALKPVRLVAEIHGLLFTGGSAFGLDASGGVQKYLEERGIGFDVQVTKVPIVPTAVIFDLAVGDAKVRPTAEMAYRACLAASATEVRTGLVGAGCGATVGKIRGMQHCMLGGVGMASWGNGTLAVGALVVVNALGDVIDPKNGKIIAGAKNDDGSFTNTHEYLKAHPDAPFTAWGNTTLAVVATNAAFKKEAITKIAEMAQDGLARAVRPAHTPFDGDMVFSLSVGTEKADVMAVGAIAAELVAEAIVQAVRVSNRLG
ncbi:MAG: P1 family peptidase [candidate division KSB1 bacterium]|nr:P1 family peptidase [candidate division KSB1 bacterium]MDZ7304439.1 P1 family peptidase [candidate division KSB1 bacterium]MDZ7310932.1 P1 family peptidase [candidate division KSB1 bacterium]